MMKTSAFSLAVLCASAIASPVGAQQPDAAAAMPTESAAAPVVVDCPVLLQEAEVLLERGSHASAARRWKEAVPVLREAGSAFLKVAAACPSVAIQANRQGDRATAELKLAEGAMSHQSECLPRLDKALDLDLRATAARNDKGDPAEVERLLGEAEGVWREAVGLCQSPHREKAEKSLAATVRLRAANAELLSAGPACDAAWKSAGALVDYARGAWKDKRWDDAAMLYDKAAMAWEGAADKCSGTRQQQAQRKAEQTHVDAHNAEHCGPLWDAATDQAQRLKTNGAGLSASERDQLSIRAEVGWRDAATACRGAPQTLARTNADALARERGAPLPAQAMAMYGSKKVAPPGPAGASGQPAAPGPAPVVTAAAGAAAAAATPGNALVAGTRTAASTVNAPIPSKPAVAQPRQADVPVVEPRPAPAADGVVVAGDTTYRGAFSIVSDTGEVSGTGSVEWANGERFTGTLVKGRRQGKGRFNWVGGQWYEGDWVDDRAVGYGVIQFPGGNRYEGAVQDGEPGGRGTLVFASGDRYTGEFSRGLFHGQGTYAWKNGNRYEGAWVLGKKHGLGRLFWASGEGWEGEFRDDLKTEVGKDIAAAAPR